MWKIVISLSANILWGSTGSTERLNTTVRATNNASGAFLEDLLREMDVRIKPVKQDDSAVTVHCGLYIASFGSVSEMHMDYKMSMFLRQIWTDSRVQYNASVGPQSVSLSGQSRDKIWVPDIYFPNEKEARFHDITVPNTMIKIYPNGTIMYSVRITLQLSCPMNLAAFPMDTQTCVFKLESYAYELHDLLLQWMDVPVEIDEDLELPQFSLGKMSTSTCSKIYKATGRYSCLKVSFTLHRQFGFFLLQTYIPSMLIVILSWVSFWINVDAVPARISLGVTTVLTMTTQLSGSTSSIPKVSYPKAIDVWLTVCMMFVFGALIEYAFVNDLERKFNKDKYKKTEDIKARDIQMDMNQPGTSASAHQTGTSGSIYQASTSGSIYQAGTSAGLSAGPGVATTMKWNLCNQNNIAQSIDKTSRILFPVAFMLFNIVYWPMYSSATIT